MLSEDKDTALNEKVDEFIDKFANPYLAAERGFVDDIIEPKDTSKKLIYYFEFLKIKLIRIRKKSTEIFRFSYKLKVTSYKLQISL